MPGKARALTLRNLFTLREKDASSCQEQLDEFRKLVGAMRKWLKESEGKMPPAETSLGTQELHKCRQQIQVGSGSQNQAEKVGSWCGTAGMWNKAQEAETWEVFYESRESWAPLCVHPVVPALWRRERGEGPGAAWFPFPSHAGSGQDLGLGDPSTLVFTECFPSLDVEGGLPSSKPPLLSGTVML